MGLSKRHIDTQEKAYTFNTGELADKLESRLPEVVFAYLLGSAAQKTGHEAQGLVKPHSDLDIAVYLDLNRKTADNQKFDLLALYSTARDVTEEVVGPVRCDLGILNNAEPVFRYEALKGRLLFSRDEELRSAFFSLTCREYEHRMFDYKKQRRYRLEARGIMNEAQGS